MLLLFTAAFPAFADDPLADDDADLFKEKQAEATTSGATKFQEEDDIVIPIEKPKPPEPAKAAPPAGPARSLGLDLSSAKPFGDNWAPTLSVVEKDAVVVDMPVLYGSGKASYAGKDAWLIAEVWSDGKKLTESRVYVTKDAIADQAASVQFFRLYSPTTADSGVLEVKVSRLVSGATKNELLFTRSVSYSR